MAKQEFTGVFTALITPMKGGKVSFDELAALVESQIRDGVDGLVPAGTTGESPTLAPDEHIDVVRCVVEAANGRVPVIAGAGANSTEEALHLSREADRAGADALLHVAPYYNKPTPEGLFRHFEAIAKETDKPIVLYSIPGRCGIEIPVGTVARLHEACPNVCAIKESGGNAVRALQLLEAVGSDLSILSGEDDRTLAYMALGGTGVISVASNIVPEELRRMVHAALEGDFGAARQRNFRLYPLMRDIFIEASPAPIKYAMAKVGMIASDELRLPLVQIMPESRRKLEATLAQLGLLD